MFADSLPSSVYEANTGAVVSGQGVHPYEDCLQEQTAQSSGILQVCC